ncbi:hypothetical protein B0T19DRAFT_438271 [Cercophora scortea]|uniref:Uncharacterized protein n=1 Tax=Cercophora scortea TaxID=314031 RepID=A0AAE0J681_9PEZI|nr:hypothetical protein B0T19DRAFT_438271 [Cercophora scortea]
MSGSRRSLRGLTKKKDRTVNTPRASLPQRFHWLARHLAQTFMELLKVRWFHKGFDSRRVLFFRSADTGIGIALDTILFDNPFVTGFQYSRPPQAPATSPRFKAAYDIYIPSAVRLEISLHVWQPLKSIVLAQYQDAVVRGLRWLEDSTPQNGHSDLITEEAEVVMLDVQRMFWDNTVRPPGQCACGAAF